MSSPLIGHAAGASSSCPDISASGIGNERHDKGSIQKAWIDILQNETDSCFTGIFLRCKSVKTSFLRTTQTDHRKNFEEELLAHLLLQSKPRARC